MSEKTQNCFDFLDEWAAGKKRDPDVINNVNKMVRKFGKSSDPTKTCKTCIHLISVQGNSKNYLKCELYGISKCTASDFRAKWQACGKYEAAK